MSYTSELRKQTKRNGLSGVRDLRAVSEPPAAAETLAENILLLCPSVSTGAVCFEETKLSQTLQKAETSSMVV